MIADARKLARDLGMLGWLSVAVLAGSVGFHLRFIQPLEHERQLLEDMLVTRPVQADGNPGAAAASKAQAARVTEFYSYFDRVDRTEQSLAKLHGIAGASGLNLRAAEYRLAETRQRFQRYEISLPVHGSYAQIRLFVETSLREMPTLSLDRATLRRTKANDSRVEAELVLTLHRLQP